MGRPGESLGDAFITLIIWRLVREIGYVMVGTVRPGWRKAIPLLRARDKYADRSTMNVDVYSNPFFKDNLRAFDAEIARVKRGGGPQPFRLPHDFPPGAQETVARQLITR